MKHKIISLITLLLSTALVVACNPRKPSSQNNDGVSSNNQITSAINSENNNEQPNSSVPAPISSLVPSSTPAPSSNNQGPIYSAPTNSNEQPASNPEPSSVPTPSSNPTIPSSMPLPSSEPTSSPINSSEPVVNVETLDDDLELFLSDLNVNIPALNEYEFDYTVLFSFTDKTYYFYAEADDKDATLEATLQALFAKENTLTSYNDDTYYPVDTYGYLFADESENIIVNFFNDEDVLVLYVYRYDGLHGNLDVSEVDTSWYVDYINLYGFVLLNNFPGVQILDNLGIIKKINIPYLESEYYPSLFSPSAYSQSAGSYSTATFNVIFEGDQLFTYINLLKEAGYEAEIVEHTDQTIDMETYQLVDYTYYTGVAFDSTHSLMIEIEVMSSDGNTAVNFYNFDDVYTAELTSNTTWSDEEKELMNNILHQELPFMPFGADYELYDDSDEEYTILILEDTYYKDLSENYITLLLEAGFKEDSTSYEDYVCYYYDNGLVYIEIFPDYSYGHYYEIYAEESHLPALTALNLNQASLDIVAGATYQLEPVLTPSSATYPLTWSSNNEDVATVDNKGLVTINKYAAVDSKATITVLAPNGLTASCTFTVKADEVTGILLDQQDYYVRAGESLQTNYTLLPIGATMSSFVHYGFKVTGEGVHIDGFGLIAVDADTEPGTTATVVIYYGSTYEIYATAVVHVLGNEIVDTLNREFFGIAVGASTYDTYKKTTDDGAVYEAQAAGKNGLQIRSKNKNSGVIGHFEGRSCKQINFVFDDNTYEQRDVEIYASNEPFSIADMYGTSVTKVGTISYDQSDNTTYTQTYTFTANYSYIGFKSADGAIYFTSVEVVW